jgi:hypothetical protein
MIDVDRKESPQKAQTSSLSKDTSRKEWEYEEDLVKVYSRCSEYSDTSGIISSISSH